MENATEQLEDTQEGGIINLFKPTKGYLIVPIIVIINIIVFLLMCFSGVGIMEPSTESLIKWGANYGPLTQNGESWRLLTSNYEHIGIFHIFMNLYALIYIGVYLEPIIQSWRFFVAYCITGVIGSIASIWWNPYVVSAGASGAIFGMYGLFLALLTTKLIDRQMRKPLLISIGTFVIFNLLNGLSGSIDNAAHIAGLVSGIILGFLMYPSLVSETVSKLKNFIWIICSTIILIFSVVVFNRLPNYSNKYESGIANIIKLESEALSIYKLPATTPKDSMLYYIKKKGINNWTQCMNTINNLNTLPFPEYYKKNLDILKGYINLRINSYELLYKNYEQDTDIYNAQLDSLSIKIEEQLEKYKNN